MIRRVLVANRGEIALRILRACREQGLQTVAVYSEADRDAPYLRLADEAVCIGPGPSGESYLNIPRILSAAEIADVDAIHPGYGFLAENSHFAEICRESRITFIGPTPEAMSLLGDKVRARALAKKMGVPTTPGSDGPIDGEEEALRIAHEIGYPLMIKAAAGGGGRGIRAVHNDASLVHGIRSARAEAEASFKDGTLYIEKRISPARHIEIQVLIDGEGNAVHLGERDCSVQRRHQKMIEESPSPHLSSKTRKALGNAAVKLAVSAGYTNAGTVEFLMDPDENFYFLEMNARIQVEHPVTEAVTGIDLVRTQLRIASGEELGFSQRDVRLRGAAIECRVIAEDPANDFRPSPGRVTRYVSPGGIGVRVDSHLCAGYVVPPHYDSMLAKVIVHRPSREEARRAMRRALEEYEIEGIATNLPFLQDILRHARYVEGKVDIAFLEEHFKILRR